MNVLAVFLSESTLVIVSHPLPHTAIKMSEIGPKKYQKIARMYDCTGLSRKCTLIKTGFLNLRTGTGTKFRPFVDALVWRLLLSGRNFNAWYFQL